MALKADVVIQVNSEQEYFVKEVADAAGAYFHNFDTSLLEMGQHSTKSKTALANAVSTFSKTVNFKVGTKTVLADQNTACNRRGDLNDDCRVNLVDFSIAAFWYKKLKPPAKIDVNGDGKVDLTDFSIMAFNWTG